jgi:hypothetical protein
MCAVGFNLDDYTPVSERIKQFWIDHPNGAIHSELVFDDGTRCVVKTTLWLDKNDSQPTTVDYAEELIADRGVNATSRIENCCTSSQGRSLAAAGYLGADWTKKPSREEMAKVQRQTTSNGPAVERGTDPRMPSVTVTQPAGLATEKQVYFAGSFYKKDKREVPSKWLATLTSKEMSALIDDLKEGKFPEPDTAEEPF